MRITVLALMFLAAGGCVYPQAELRQPFAEEIMPDEKPTYANGSIWQEHAVSLFDEHKARHRGDVLTVVIEEEASASKQASTGTKKEAGYAASIPNFMGIEQTALADKLNLNALINAKTSSNFDGNGSTTRKDYLNATITARVMNVLPNGDLRIEGRRSVKVNNEEQIIILQGIVRPKDIDHQNMISSSRIADARITYSGNGIISDRQQPGWLYNFIDKVWPF
jgi:flagellar L-ring protein precursor FlgH